MANETTHLQNTYRDTRLEYNALVVCYMSLNSNIYHFQIPSFLIAFHAYVYQSTLATERSYSSHHLYYPQIYININREMLLYVTKFQY